MRELSIEEKAKAYDEALERARLSRLQLLDIGEEATEIEYIFPELKEESEDERIKKDIIDFVRHSVNRIPAQKFNKYIAWLEKQTTPQVRTGLEWVNTIDDACDRRYSEEYSHGEYCHEQSFKWGFQEGVDWLEKQDKQEATDNKEKLNVLNFIRKETCCGLAEANNSLLELIKVLKERPLPIMDKPHKLKIEWEK